MRNRDSHIEDLIVFSKTANRASDMGHTAHISEYTIENAAVELSRLQADKLALVEALQRTALANHVARGYDKWSDHFGFGNNWEECTATLCQQARAALAKVKGE